MDTIILKAKRDTINYVQDLGLHDVAEDFDELLQPHRQELTNKDLLDTEAENKREKAGKSNIISSSRRQN